MPEEYASYVGKEFQGREGTSYLRGSRWKVIEFIPLHDFGRYGGRKPAYRIERQDAESQSVVRADQFNRTFEPHAPEEPAATVTMEAMLGAIRKPDLPVILDTK